ncbi:glycosyltransferase family 2 protein [Dyadobacter luticola]|uniref:Glycosyltransferase n=1 Tax=Dyadobacter luticola TaxID=1979387 RepID=A0A5R9KY83_9BACT|nr:glycosyltransferase family 2 protein [Dyadobacter luticola]TLV01272.1 glycosyltransferase [Dyadobacter luticola]
MNKPETKISIVTVCFNSAITIADTIESVLNQDYQPHEYILVDGASTDKTVQIIKTYEDVFRERGISYLYISEPDKGIYDAMNKGIAMATGELIGIVNSDDWYEKDALNLISSRYEFTANRSNTVFYGIIRLWLDGKEYAIRRYHHNFISREVIQHPTCFVPKALYNKHGAFNAEFRVCGDFDLLNRFNSKHVEFCNIDHVLTNFRIGGATSSHAAIAKAEALKVKLDFGTIGKKEYEKEIFKMKLRAFIKKFARI